MATKVGGAETESFVLVEVWVDVGADWAGRSIGGSVGGTKSGGVEPLPPHAEVIARSPMRAHVFRFELRRCIGSDYLGWAMGAIIFDPDASRHEIDRDDKGGFFEKR